MNDLQICIIVEEIALDRAKWLGRIYVAKPIYLGYEALMI